MSPALTCNEGHRLSPRRNEWNLVKLKRCISREGLPEDPLGLLLGVTTLAALHSHLQARDGHRLDHQTCLHAHISRPTTVLILTHPQSETPPQTIPAAPRRRKSPNPRCSPSFAGLSRETSSAFTVVLCHCCSAELRTCSWVLGERQEKTLQMHPQNPGQQGSQLPYCFNPTDPRSNFWVKNSYKRDQI